MERQRKRPCLTAQPLRLHSSALFVLLVINGYRLCCQAVLDALDAFADASAQLGQALAAKEHESYCQYQ